MTIKAPFNFVPLSDTVYFPDWAEKISQDVPFSDGISGSIEIEIDAKTPIFVCDGHPQDKQDNNETNGDNSNQNNNINPQSFSKTPDGRFFIPGSSIKGAVRNVLEVMSFGKMKLDKRAMFAHREWDREQYDLLNPNEQSRLHCGYLKRNGDCYVINDCDKPYRIANTRIDEYLEEPIFRDYFESDSRFDLNEVDPNTNLDPKTAIFKYKLLEGKKAITDLRFSIDEDYAVEYRENRVKVDPNGDFTGDIVLTGQPDKWKYSRQEKRKQFKGKGKFYEFVFKNKIIHTYTIDAETFEHFKFIYENSDEWTRIKSLLDSDKGVPVFFRPEGNDRIKDFGMAFLYKLPYDRSPYDTLGARHKKDNPDLAECIFGKIGDKSLKGRVQFSNAFATEHEVDREYRLTLSSPKASYYPMYIEQEGRNGVTTRYQTYDRGRLAGWKRYPIRNGVWEYSTGSEKLDTIIIPLKTAKFIEIIRFHNLRPIELGALLSAITFHGNEGCYHSVGQGKPYGFGKVTFKINKRNFKVDSCGFDQDKYLMALYENQMNAAVPGWINSPSLKELITMAHDLITDADSHAFKYMTMNNNRNENEFLKAKGEIGDAAKEFLQRFSKLKSDGITPESQLKKINADLARKLIGAGDVLYDDGNFEGALLKYKEAKDFGSRNVDKKILDCERKVAENDSYKRYCELVMEGDKLHNDSNFREAKNIYEQAQRIDCSLITPDERNHVETRIGECEQAIRNNIPFPDLIQDGTAVTTNWNSIYRSISEYIKKKRIATLSDEEIMQVEEWYRLNKPAELNKKQRKEWANIDHVINRWRGH